MWPKAGQKKKDKVIPQDARETEELAIEVDTYMGPGKSYAYDCVLGNPDRHQELLQNYEIRSRSTCCFITRYSLFVWYKMESTPVWQWFATELAIPNEFCDKWPSWTKL